MSTSTTLPTVAITFVETDERGRTRGEALVRGRGIRKARIAFSTAPWMPLADVHEAVSGKIYMSPAANRIAMAIKAKLAEQGR